MKRKVTRQKSYHLYTDKPENTEKDKERRSLHETYEKKILVITLILTVLLVSGCQESDEAKYKNAQSLMAKGKYSEAAEKFDELGSYEEASKLSMYCKAAAAGENGEYETAFSTFTLLGEYKESQMMIVYYKARQLEASGRNEENGLRSDILSAAETYDTIELFRDSKDRAEACRKTVYAWGEDAAKEGNYYYAANVMEALGNYSDCVFMVKYYNACSLETYGSYRAAADVFSELGEFKDSKARTEGALQKGYDAAIAFEKEGNADKASEIFISLGDYKDSLERGGKSTYERAEKLLAEGSYLQASRLFAKAFSYKDALKRSWSIRYKYLKEYQVYKLAGLLYIDESGKVKYVSDNSDSRNSSPDSVTTRMANSMKSAVALGYWSGLQSDGTVAFFHPDVPANQAALFSDIVQYDCAYDGYYGLKSDGTVVVCLPKEKDNRMAETLSTWQGIVKVQYGQTGFGGPTAYGLRYDGTVLCAQYGKTTTICSNVVDISFASLGGYGGCLFCLLENGSIQTFNDNQYREGKDWIKEWEDIEYISTIDETIIGLQRSGEWLIGSETSYHVQDIELKPDTANIAGDSNNIIILDKNGGAHIAYKHDNKYSGYEQYLNSVEKLVAIGSGSELK